MHQRPVLARADEIKDDAHERITRKLPLDLRKPLTKDARPDEQGAVGIAQAANVVAREAAPAHADHIEPIEHGALGDGKAERNDVGTDTTHTGHHGALTDAHELMDGGGAAKDDPIAQHDVTAKYSVVGQDHVIANVAIVPDMSTDHEEAAVAHMREPAAIFGAGVHGDMLANVTAGADLEPRRSAAILDRLRRRAERRERIDLGARSDAGMAGHVNMSDQGASLADHNIRADHAIGTDCHLRPDRRSLSDAGGRINRGHGITIMTHSTTTMAPT